MQLVGCNEALWLVVPRERVVGTVGFGLKILVPYERNNRQSAQTTVLFTSQQVLFSLFPTFKTDSVGFSAQWRTQGALKA